jgi:hypothetical protein
MADTLNWPRLLIPWVKSQVDIVDTCIHTCIRRVDVILVSMFSFVLYFILPYFENNINKKKSIQLIVRKWRLVSIYNTRHHFMTVMEFLLILWYCVCEQNKQKTTQTKTNKKQPKQKTGQKTINGDKLQLFDWI